MVAIEQMISITQNLVDAADVIIMGASTRAAAFSALRAGLRPYCLDFFGDFDTGLYAALERVDPYPDGLFAILERLPRLPVVYTGGLENRLDILEFAAQRHLLWGNDVTAVKRARDPVSLAEVARLSKINFPEWRSEEDPPPMDGTWLLRPRAGSGGRGIGIWNEEQAGSLTLQEPHLFQKRIEGQSYSAVFIAPAAVGDIRFVGLTRQLVGEAACNAAPFQWCGNIGPMALPVTMENVIRRFGNVLKWKLGLRGLFGVDFIFTEEGIPWVTEVNPRYPASVEILEHATGQPLFLDHCRCFSEEKLPDSTWNLAHPGEFMGKAIYYSPADLTLNQPLADPSTIPYLEFPQITDLPLTGVPIPKGTAVCTLFAESFSADQTRHLLQEQLEALQSELFAVKTVES